MSRQHTMPAYLAILLFFAAGVSSAAPDKVALGNLKPIDSSMSVSSDCSRIYNTAVPGCSSLDFFTGRCSGDCLRGLDMIQANLQRSCTSLSPTINTLVGQALFGNLVQVLCPENFKPSTSSAQATTSQQKPAPSSTSASDNTPSTTIDNSDNAASPTVGLPPPVVDGGSSSSTSTKQHASQETRRVGGSPFDIQGQQSSAVAARSPAALFGFLSILGTLALVMAQ